MLCGAVITRSSRLTCRIADAICSKIKVKKNEILYRDVREDLNWSGWSSYPYKYKTTKKILIVRPCKEFFAINKKLSRIKEPKEKKSKN